MRPAPAQVVEHGSSTLLCFALPKEQTSYHFHWQTFSTCLPGEVLLNYTLPEKDMAMLSPEGTELLA